MNPDAVIDDFIERPDPTLLSPFLLRLARGQSRLCSALDSILESPAERALCGLQAASTAPPSSELEDMTLWVQACVDAGVAPDPGLLEELEPRAQQDLQWWGPVARAHAKCSSLRENQARMALSEQSIPYVFPGTLHPMQIELLAAGDCILPALHVDWVRKLSALGLEALVLDLRYSGGWFWPLLEVIDGRKASRMIRAAAPRPRRGRGGLGMLGAYLTRLGESVDSLVPKFAPADRLVAAVAIIGDRPTSEVRPGLD